MAHCMYIASDPACIHEVADFLEKHALAFGLDESAAGDVVIAGTEAVNNAILHGNRSEPELRVQVIFHEGHSDCVVLEVQDEGRDFTPDTLPDPTSADRLMDEGGRGWLIIRHLMDEVEVLQGQDGTRVIMKKRLQNS